MTSTPMPDTMKGRETEKDDAVKGRFKFTPGPWSVPHFAEPDANCECGYVLCDIFMGAIATVHCSGEGDDWKKHGDNPKFIEAVANARLIASGPDLVRALVAIEEHSTDQNAVKIASDALAALSRQEAQG